MLACLTPLSARSGDFGDNRLVTIPKRESAKTNPFSPGRSSKLTQLFGLLS